MTKLSNGIEYMNPCFPREFGEFLLVNGFRCHAVKDRLHFCGDKTRVVIQHDNLDLFLFHPETNGHVSEKWTIEQSHTGISHFNLFSWIMLMHIMQIMPMTEFIKNSRNAGEQVLTEAKFIVHQVIQSQIVN